MEDHFGYSPSSHPQHNDHESPNFHDDSFQAMLGGNRDGDGDGGNADLDMLIDHEEEEDGEEESVLQLHAEKEARESLALGRMGLRREYGKG